MFYIIYFIVNELAKLYKFGWHYWKSYVLIADLAVIALVNIDKDDWKRNKNQFFFFQAIAAFIFYALRFILTLEILDTFVETKGNGYVKLQ